MALQFAEPAFAKGLELVCRVDDCVPPVVEGDFHRVKQIVSNLVSNAVKFTERGQILLTLNCTCGVDPGSGRRSRCELRYSVADTGVGIAAEDLQNVFQPYFRGKHSGKAGHGIGLTIVKRLSERFGWPVDLQSTEGVGTTVTVRFPNPQPV